jgi:biopolymer transport protein ExbD
VQLWVDGGANQQRVIDVLNALVGAGISSVTFTDLVD